MIIKIYTFNCRKVNHCLLAYEFNRILKALPSPRKPYTLLRSGGAPLLTSCLLTLLSLFLPRADQLQFSAFQTTCCVHSRETWQAPCGFSGHPSLHPYLANALHLVLAIILLCKSLNLTWVLPPLLLHCHAESTQLLVVNFQPSLQGAHNTQRNHF